MSSVDAKDNTNSEPAVLYHYTSLQAMMKIVKSQEIWATSIAYLNDVMERRLFLEVVAQELPGFAAQKGIYDLSDFQRILEASWSTGQSPSVTGQPFAASFSAEADSLMHWRSYCPEANGVSIGFRTSCLKEAQCISPSKKDKSLLDTGMLFFSIPNPIFKKIEYINATTSQITVLKAMEDAYEEAVSFTNEQDEVDPEERTSISLEDLFAYNLEAAASFFKHSSFYGEQEYRLLIGSLDFRPDVLKFRTTRSALIPYVELTVPGRNRDQFPIPTFKSSATYWDAIEEIILGPSPNQSLSHQALQAFFYSMDMEVNIRNSSVPYRDW